MDKLENNLDDEDPLWCINAQIIGLMEGYGATEDHEMVLAFFAGKDWVAKSHY